MVRVDGAMMSPADEEEEAKLRPPVGAETDTEVAVAFGIICVRLPATPDDSEVFVTALAEGREGRLPDRVDDNLAPDRRFVGAHFEPKVSTEDDRVT